MKRIGSRLEVMLKKENKWKLTKKNLKYNKNGKIISKKISKIMKKKRRNVNQ